MGMTRDDFYKIAAGLRAAYKRDRLLDDQSAFDVWYELLKDLDYDIAAAAAQAYMTIEHFPPVPADIRKKAAELINWHTDMTEGEAWMMVRKAISNGIYGSREEYAALPEVIQKALGSPEQLKIWAMDEGFSESVAQSQFLRSYRVQLQRQKTEDLLPASVRMRLGTFGTDPRMLDERNPRLLSDPDDWEDEE